MNDPEAHRLQHVDLHHALDELVACFVEHHRGTLLDDTTLLDLMEWSSTMTLEAHQRPEAEPIAARLRVLEHALRESVRLQSHYATLLNVWDGGTRQEFHTPEAWLARLAERRPAEAEGAPDA